MQHRAYTEKYWNDQYCLTNTSRPQRVDIISTVLVRTQDEHLLYSLKPWGLDRQPFKFLARTSKMPVKSGNDSGDKRESSSIKVCIHVRVFLPFSPKTKGTQTLNMSSTFPPYFLSVDDWPAIDNIIQACVTSGYEYVLEVATAIIQRRTLGSLKVSNLFPPFRLQLRGLLQEGRLGRFLTKIFSFLKLLNTTIIFSHAICSNRLFSFIPI